jgi:predicted transcriptional regulator
MSRKPGANTAKIQKIRSALRENPQGIWVREISRKTGLDKSTVSIYLSKHMKKEIEEVFPIKGSLIKIVRLKK